MDAGSDVAGLPYPRQQARTRRFTLGRARSFRVAPDGSRVLFLRSAGPDDAVNRLWAYDVAAGQERLVADPHRLNRAADEQLSAEERARRERLREVGGGITSYSTDNDLATASFALGGRVFAVEVRTAEVIEVGVVGPAFDPRLDPTGQRVAYVAERELYVAELGGGGRRIVGEDDPDVSWGLAEFIAAEEMGRQRGFWWAPDGQRLIAARVDAFPVETWHIADPAHPDRAPREWPYPATGTANANVTLAVFDLQGGRVEVDWDLESFPYLAGVRWGPGGPPLLTVQSRDQREVRILALDPDTGTTEVARSLTDDTWVELIPGSPDWLDGGRLVTIEDTYDGADGTRKLLVDGETVSPDGLQVRRLVSATHDTLWFTASQDPTTTDVYELAVRSGQLTCHTDGEGVHDAVVGGDVVLVVSSRLERHDPVAVVRQDGVSIATIESLAARPNVDPQVRLLELGERGVRAALLLPSPGSGVAADARLPVLLDPYGGPHAQRVIAAQAAYLTPQWFADQGFAVLVVDGRGTPGRGPVWERAVHRDLATPVLDDQIDALHAAAELEPRLDLSRVAIRGWSFGGYLAALAVLRRPDVFRAGIVGAPVTDWRLYDTHYTERYLGHPDEHPDAYERSSVVGASGALVDAAPVPDDGVARDLLIVHGMADDNVFAAHTLRLSSALLAAGRPHAVLPLSGVTHMTPQEVVAENLMAIQADFLRRSLAQA